MPKTRLAAGLALIALGTLLLVVQPVVRAQDGPAEEVPVLGARTIWRHDRAVRGAVWHADSTRILSWGADDTARVWDPATGGELVRVNHRAVSGAAWRPDGGQFLTWGADGAVRIWEATTGRQIAWLEGAPGTALKGAAWSPEGTRIATWDSVWRAGVWSVVDGARVAELAHQGPVEGARWSADGSWLLTWSLDGAARVWDGTTGALRSTSQHGAPLADAFWSADESLLLTLGQDGTVRRWDMRTGALQMIYSHERYVPLGALLADDRLLTWGLDGMAVMWTSDGTVIDVVRVAGPLWGAIWRADRILLHGGGGVAWLWTPGGPDPVALTHAARITAVDWHETSILTTSDDRTARLWDAASGAPRYVLPHTEPVLGGAWSPDGRWLATWARDGVYLWAVPDPNACLISAPANANLRAGPSVNAAFQGTLAAGTGQVATGQAPGADGFTWWRLESGAWVRADVVEETGPCDGLPVVAE